uniref:Uncharacterized protein n=1 Tax=Heterorhabditis bacteriophora TaxID=37862 RepID=A0A1I7WKT4_HETBA
MRRSQVIAEKRIFLLYMQITRYLFHSREFHGEHFCFC